MIALPILHARDVSKDSVGESAILDRLKDPSEIGVCDFMRFGSLEKGNKKGKPFKTHVLQPRERISIECREHLLEEVLRHYDAPSLIAFSRDTAVPAKMSTRGPVQVIQDIRFSKDDDERLQSFSDFDDESCCLLEHCMVTPQVGIPAERWHFDF
jgi:hypothetical protein